MNFLGVIPARLSSTRLPRKVLREIAGLPMVVHVFNRARACSLLTDVLVATDSDEVVDVCHTHHIPAVMTSSQHPSGTDRLWEVSRARVADVYDREVQMAVKRFLSVLEPALILSLAVLIGGIVFSILLGVMGMSELVQ